jgi:hypothetical protein
VQQNRLVTGLAAAFAVMTAILAVGAIFVLPLAIPAVLFGAVTYFLYYQASGRLLRRIYRSVERQAATGNGSAPSGRGGFGAGPREEWTPPREEQRRRARGQRVRQERRRGQRQRRQRRQSGPTPREASRVLGVSVDADEGTVKRAYRNRIKDVHPDAEGGDEEAFKRVQRAYEVLTD